MTVMTIDSARLEALICELGRHRELKPEETDLVEEIVMLDVDGFRWDPRLDQGLQRASHSAGGIARFARRHSITPGAAYQRLTRLRKRQRRKAAPRKRRG